MKMKQTSTVEACVLLIAASLLVTVCEAGSWSEWSAWSGCSKTCGEGYMFRKKELVPAEGEPVPDNPLTFTDKYTCEAGPCPVDGKWSAWGTWTKCTEACGGGTKRRDRTCSNPAPVGKGKKCEGLNWEEEECNTVSCPPLPVNFDVSKCNASMFMCESKEMCIPINQECDKIVQCNDGSDEESCDLLHIVGGQIGGRYGSVRDRSGASQSEVTSMMLGVVFLVFTMFILH